MRVVLWHRRRQIATAAVAQQRQLQRRSRLQLAAQIFEEHQTRRLFDLGQRHKELRERSAVVNFFVREQKRRHDAVTAFLRKDDLPKVSGDRNVGLRVTQNFIAHNPFVSFLFRKESRAGDDPHVIPITRQVPAAGSY
jgi:hypothetical protein